VVIITIWHVINAVKSLADNKQGSAGEGVGGDNEVTRDGIIVYLCFKP